MSSPPAKEAATRSVHLPQDKDTSSCHRPAKRQRTDKSKSEVLVSTASSSPPQSASAGGTFDQVTALDRRYKLPLRDADVYYVPDFVPDASTQQRWYDGVLAFDGWYQPKLKMYGREITQSRKIAAFATDPSLVVKYSGQTVNMCYEYPSLLREIQDEVENLLGVRFNHCMLNYYDDGSVYIGKHRDNKENKVIASLSLGAERTFVMSHDAPPGSAAAEKLEARAKASAAKVMAKVGKAKKAKQNQAQDVAKDEIDERSIAEISTTRLITAGTQEHDDDPATAPLVYEHKWKLSPGSLVVMQGETQKRWKHEIPREKEIKAGRVSLTFRQLEYD